MKCQILFSGKNITNLSSAELAQREVKVKRAINRQYKIVYLVNCHKVKGLKWQHKIRLKQGNPISGYRRLRDFGGKQMTSSSDRVCIYPFFYSSFDKKAELLVLET